MRTALRILALALALAASAATTARQTVPLHGKITDALKRMESRKRRSGRPPTMTSLEFAPNRQTPTATRSACFLFSIPTKLTE